MAGTDSWASSPGRRANMRAIRSRDTGPELAVRRLLHARGLRFRVAYRPLAGLQRTADIVFTRRRVAVFIDGCYWHGCPDHYRAPRVNTDYWGPKIARNRVRDAETNVRLSAAGWTVLRYWEHEEPSRVAEEVEAVVGPMRSVTGATSRACI